MVAAAGLVAALALGAPTAKASELLLGTDGGSGYPADLLVIDPQTGKITERIGPVGYSITGLAQDPATGILYGVTGAADITNPSFLVRIDPHTGAATLIGDEIPTSDTAAADITFRADGTLFGWSEDTDDLVTINKDTGLATVVSNSAHSTSGSGIAFDSAGTLWFAGDDDNGPLSNVNPATGLVSPVVTMDGTTGWQISALAFNGAGTLFGSRVVTTGPRAADLITIDRTTGHITSTHNQILRLDALVFVNSQTRSITLHANKKKVKQGKNVVLSGAVTSPDPGCAAGQTVTIATQAGAVATAATAADGSYSAKLPVTKAATFQATVGTTAICDDATSAPTKVKVKPGGKR
jgi:hypothetical protein